MPYQNQVLEGVQNRIKSRLDEDLKRDSEYKTRQADALHKIIWDPDATDEMRERAHKDLEKLYPQSKDLIGRIREASGKVFGFLKAPPTTREDAQKKSDQDWTKMTGTPPYIDPEMAQTYSGMLAPPPAVTATAPSAPQQQQQQQPTAFPAGTDENVASTYTGMLAPPPTMQAVPAAASTAQPAAAGQPFAAGGKQLTDAERSAAMMPPPPVGQRPPSYPSDVGEIVRTKQARLKQEEIEKEQRTAETTRETKRLELKQTGENARDLAEATAKAQQKYGEHWAASTQFMYNQDTGQVVLLPAGAKPDNTLSEVELAYRAEDPSVSPEIRAAAGRALERLRQLKAVTTGGFYDVVLGDGVYKVHRSQMDLPQSELEAMAKRGELQAAPRTLYDAAGNPTVGGKAGSTTAPPTIPETTQSELSGMKTTIDLYERQILPNLEKMRADLGPIMGRIKVAEVSKAGGYGATPEQVKLLTDMETALMSEAFANGGKQLTGNEKQYFEDIRPKPTDLFSTALIKAENAAAYLRSKYNDRLGVMPANQRRQMSPLPPPPTGGAGAGAQGKAGDIVRVKHPDGRNGTIPRANLEAAKKQGFTEVK
jgi:hypothetical protein